MPSEQDFPARTSVVVIGGGIVGASIALHLAQKGVPVVLCEKGRIGGEQSSRNWGWTRLMGRDPAELPLGLVSLKLWSEMNAITGAETGWRRCGITYLCQTEADLAAQQRWLDLARLHQIETHVLRAAEIPSVLPGLAGGFTAAIHTPGDGRAEPGQATEAVARAAASAGAVVRETCAVRAIERQAGRISAVVTERGTIACDQVVLAGGAWSRLFAGNAGIELPSLTILGSVQRTQPLDGLPEGSAGGAGFAFRRRLDGGYNIARRNGSISDITPDSFRQLRTYWPSFLSGWRELRLRLGPRFLEEWRTPRSWRPDEVTPFEHVRVLDPKPSATVLAEGAASLIRHFPGFAAMRVQQSWGGLMDVTPDTVPVISPVEALPGLHIAAGFSGHGFGLGPGAGQLMADLVTGDTPVVDPTPFRLGRFTQSPHHGR
jgi:glycine/D-amino acid oxidase-like deaminating enzyme